MNEKEEKVRIRLSISIPQVNNETGVTGEIIHRMHLAVAIMSKEKLSENQFMLHCLWEGMRIVAMKAGVMPETIDAIMNKK